MTGSAVSRVLVQGGGVGGLTLAAALGQRGIEVDVVEAAGPDAVLGVGLNQPANALAALGEIGVREQCLERGFPFEELLFWNPAGEQVAVLPPPAGLYGRPSNNAISRPVYNGILREAAEKAGARIRTGATIWRMTEDADGVEVELASLTGKRTPPVRDKGADSRRYDLVVGFDGVRSKVREHLFGDQYAPQFTGFAVWRVAMPRPTDVALISRNREKLDSLVGKLTAEGITAAAFPADVLDRDALTQALKDAATQFGGIDVLEYSPLAMGSTVLATPAESDPSHIQHEIEFQLYGAMAATKAVLPAMREAGAGTLLYTTGAGSLEPLPMVGNVNAAAAALRNWVVNLHKELDGTGIQVAHVAIDVALGGVSLDPTLRAATPEAVSSVYWDLHTTKRDQAEIVYRG